MSSVRVLDYVYDYAEPMLEQIAVQTQRALTASGSQLDYEFLMFIRADLVAEKDAEIERLTEAFNQSITDAQLPIMATMQAEIERLRKALEQAIGEPVKWEELETVWLLTEKIIKASTHAELAAYLRERDSRPPESGVQSGVQSGGDTPRGMGYEVGG